MRYPTYRLSMVTADWDGRMYATFSDPNAEMFSGIDRTLPDGYELPDWAQAMFMSLTIIPIKGTSTNVDGIGRIDRLRKKRRYAIYVPKKHNDTWRELL